MQLLETVLRPGVNAEAASTCVLGLTSVIHASHYRKSTRPAFYVDLILL